jgi:hypothetical protein
MKLLSLAAVIGFASLASCNLKSEESAQDQGYRSSTDTDYYMTFLVPSFIDESQRFSAQDALLYCAYEVKAPKYLYSPTKNAPGYTYHGDTENALFADRGAPLRIRSSALQARLPGNASLSNPVVSGVNLSLATEAGKFAISHRALTEAAGKVKRVVNSLKKTTPAERNFVNNFVDVTFQNDMNRIVGQYNASWTAKGGLNKAGWEAIIKHTDVPSQGSFNAGVSTFDILMSIAGGQSGSLAPKKGFQCPSAASLRNRLLNGNAK